MPRPTRRLGDHRGSPQNSRATETAIGTAGDGHVVAGVLRSRGLHVEKQFRPMSRCPTFSARIVEVKLVTQYVQDPHLNLPGRVAVRL